MDWKDKLQKQLKEVQELTRYVSVDNEANERLEKIRKKVETAVKALEKTGNNP